MQSSPLASSLKRHSTHFLITRANALTIPDSTDVGSASTRPLTALEVVLPEAAATEAAAVDTVEDTVEDKEEDKEEVRFPHYTSP